MQTNNGTEAQTKISVVIPFFQKRSGILRRALESVIAQRLPGSCLVEIVIVDDGSPVSASSEIETLPVSHPFKITLIQQQNQGVSAARNAGLDGMDADTDYVAFLDSDDIWQPTRLATGLLALRFDGGFFYSDHSRRGLFESHLASHDLSSLAATREEELGENLYSISKETLFSSILRAFPTHCSTVLFSAKILGNLRFEREIKAAGEDILFMAQLVQRAPRIVFSSEALVECADGINMFFSAFSEWDSPQRIAIAYDRLAAYTLMQRRLQLSGEDAAWVKDHVEAYRRDLVFFSLRKIGKKLKIPTELWKARKITKYYPAPILLALAEIFILKLRGNYSPR